MVEPRDPDEPSLRTRCVHGPAPPGPAASAAERALVTPQVRSTAYRLDDAAYAAYAAGRPSPTPIYSREDNPTVEAVERHLAAVEGAPRALLFASGMAALHAAVLAATAPRGRIVAATDLYGGSLSLLRQLAGTVEREVVAVDVHDLEAIRRALADGAELLFCESLSNPLLAVADVPALAGLAHAAGARVLVDATFATPLGQRPLELGADYVVHSATKYLAGHGDVVAGVLAAREEEAAEPQRWRSLAGGCADPFAASLVERGLKTLALRVRAHCDGAAHLAAFLADHPAVERVCYPGLPSHPTHAVGLRVLDECGGMLGFAVRGDDADALAVVRRLRLFTEAASLGGVESLASLPSNMSHVHLTEQERRRSGIPSGYVRLSVGIEDPRDLERDLRQALDAAS